MSLQTCDVRRASLDDLDALLPLVHGYRLFYQQAPDDAGERRFVAKHLRDGSSAIFFATSQDRAVGFVQLFESWSTVHLAPVLILEDLFVEDGFRGQGIARELIDAALRFAREIGAAGVFLETATGNTRAQQVYEREGWRREERFIKYNAPL
jgi:ribosomal protein S18 acetylase RimI-like enzyme